MSIPEAVLTHAAHSIIGEAVAAQGDRFALVEPAAAHRLAEVVLTESEAHLRRQTILELATPRGIVCLAGLALIRAAGGAMRDAW